MPGYLVRNKMVLVIALAFLAGLLAIFVTGKPANGAGTLLDGFEQSRFVGGLTSPTAMAFAPDGSSPDRHLFVAEQRGTLRVIDEGGQLQEKPFLDERDSIGSSGERGLLGVALDPDFATNNYVYVYYTWNGSSAIHNRVARYTASVDDQGNVVAEPESFLLLLRLPNLRAPNHNGGAIHFGNADDPNERDKLYVAVGENDRPEAAQSLKTRLGKMLRINKDGTIPTDNPYYDRASGDTKAIWARGLRNPYSFDVEPGTGRIFINDVGQKTWEEINEGEAGANYGWPVFEGPKKNRNTEAPVFAYRHGFGETTGCAITGGAFYNPVTPSFGADYVGDYFFADFCTGWIRKLDSATNNATRFKAGSGEHPVDLKVSEEGDLYFLARGTGSVEKISPSTP